MPAVAQKEMSQVELDEIMKEILGGASASTPVAQPLPQTAPREDKKREPAKKEEKDEDASKRRKTDEPGSNPGKGNSYKPTL